MKNHWRWILLLLPIAILGGVLRWRISQPEYVLRQFSTRHGGKTTTNFTDIAPQHLNMLRKWQESRRFPNEMHQIQMYPHEQSVPQPLLLRISWYCDNDENDKNALADGGIDMLGGLIQHREWLSAGSGGAYGHIPNRYSKNEIQELQNLLKHLPAGVQTPPVEHVLFVSYRNSETWESRVYDRRSLPPSMRSVLKIFLSHADLILKTAKPDQTQ